MQRSDRDLMPPASIAATLAKAAARSDRAILVGNRAGVVEWANAGWSRITGFPIAETIAKPITHFLEQAAIEIDLVDFVAQQFLDGRPSAIEFPFETFDDRAIWVHLDVQPIRNAQGEIAEFVAIATDITRRRVDDERAESTRAPHAPDAKKRSIESSTAPGTAAVLSEPLSLSAEVDCACERLVRSAGHRTQFDFDLDPRLPTIRSNRLLLGEVVRLLVRAAASETDDHWGFVTIMTGRTEIARSHVSQAHPIPARPACLASESFLFVEVHDTSPALSPSALEAIRNGHRSDEPRAQDLAMAAAIANAIGAHLHVDSTPGCGTQALLLLPISQHVDS